VVYVIFVLIACGGVQHIVCCVFLRFVLHILPVSLDCTFLISVVSTGQGPIIANLHVTREFSGLFVQTTIINGDKADSKILHLYLG